MTDKKKVPAKKPVKKTSDSGIVEQLRSALAAYKPLLSEKKFAHIVKKTTKLITDGIAKTEKKKKKSSIVKKTPAPKKAAVKKAIPKKAIPKKAVSK